MSRYSTTVLALATGSALAFGSDGKLYVTSGDRNYGEMVQDPSNHFGKILRLNPDGSVPADNPFVGREGWKPEIWSTGHRNPLGLTLDPEGRLWETEFGPRGGDELNLIEAGKNYGWMLITQGEHYDGAEKAQEWAQGVVANFARKPQGNDTSQIEAVAAGLCRLGIVNSYYTARYIGSGDKDAAVAASAGIVSGAGAGGTPRNVATMTVSPAVGL